MLYIPGMLLAFVVASVYSIISMRRSTCLRSVKLPTMQQMVEQMIDTDWQAQRGARYRLLRHGNSFAPFCAACGAGLVTFYSVLNRYWGAGAVNCFDCMMWSHEISAVGGYMYPSRNTLFNRPEDFGQWFILTCSLVLYFLCACFWGKRSQFVGDTHNTTAIKVYAGLLKISELEKCQTSTFRAFNQWVVNALKVHGVSDISQRTSRLQSTAKHRLCGCLSWILHFPAALTISWPSLLFSISKNVASATGIMAVCSNSTVVVVLNLLLRMLLLDVMVKGLAKLQRVGTINWESSQNYNKRRVLSLYVLTFLSNVCFPVLVTFWLDGMTALRALVTPQNR